VGIGIGTRGEVPGRKGLRQETYNDEDDDDDDDDDDDNNNNNNN